MGRARKKCPHFFGQKVEFLAEAQGENSASQIISAARNNFSLDYVQNLVYNVGKGYRVYFTNRNKEILILLVGGDKSTQNSDIKAAKKMAKEY